ncbi:MAG: sn-glycerol-3-phosphate ABC transporter ATP-binding protein UgpC [Rubellimicrobium sp.]|nr:sn-glycerol-3-phosphate ABC transporter ATP-binding protein UgpC [Rubellimicrobium sp.]
MAAITLSDIRKSYGATHVIKGVDITVEDGEFVVFVGPSGCGKSTLLRMIAGLEDISGGTLSIGGRRVNDLPPKDRGVAMVFQSYAIFPHMTVRENVAFGLTIAGASKEEKDAKVAEAARILQMEHLLDRRPSQLSGGQRQRVAIGRAIVRKPQVFLFDEPLSNLDAALRMDMRMEIGKLHKQLGATMIYVTHDQVEAMTLADKIVVLKDGQVMQVGTPMELYHNPANAFVAGFLGSPSMNFLDVDVREVAGNRVTVSNAALEPVTLTAKRGGFTAGGKARLGLRPQYLTPETDGRAGLLHGSVALTERLGSETVIEVTLADGKALIAALARDAIFDIGAPIQLSFAHDEAHLFPA